MTAATTEARQTAAGAYAHAAQRVAEVADRAVRTSPVGPAWVRRPYVDDLAAELRALAFEAPAAPVPGSLLNLGEILDRLQARAETFRAQAEQAGLDTPRGAALRERQLEYAGAVLLVEEVTR